MSDIIETYTYQELLEELVRVCTVESNVNNKNVNLLMQQIIMTCTNRHFSKPIYYVYDKEVVNNIIVTGV